VISELGIASDGSIDSIRVDGTALRALFDGMVVVELQRGHLIVIVVM
jgi:hypothetical protein